MAVWQFDLYFFPADILSRRFKILPAKLPSDVLEDYVDWPANERAADFSAAISRFLPAAPSWNADLSVWGSDQGDRVDLWRDGNSVVSLKARIDVRNLSIDFVRFIAELARNQKCLLLTTSDDLIAASADDVLAALKESAAARFVRDPKAFLDAIAKNETPND